MHLRIIALSLLSLPLRATQHHTINYYLSLRLNPYISSFLDVIAYAEGTYGDHGTGDKYHGYKQCFAGHHFTSFKDHPQVTVSAFMGKKKLYSSAAGRYQLLDTTWDYIQKKLDLKAFCPLAQDIAALYLLDKKRAIPDILLYKLTDACKKTNTIWASLPGSPYGQPTKSIESIRRFFRKRVSFYSENPNSLALDYMHS
jgi:muramidase (phage lysozyme)